MSLWENEETVRERILQRVLIGAGAGAAALVIFWVLHNALALIAHPGNGAAGFAATGQERRYLDDGEPGGTAAAAPGLGAAPGRGAAFSPASPARRLSAPSYSIAVRPANVAPAPLLLPPPAAAGPGLTEQERTSARLCLVPLRQTYAAVQDFDQRSFWNRAPGLAARPVVMRPGEGRAARDDGADPGSAPEVDNATDALGAMVALYGHPGRFPEPLRGDVGAAAEGMRGYLELTRNAAATDDPSERRRMRSAAERRLSEANAALQRAESLLGAGGMYTARFAR